MSGLSTDIVELIEAKLQRKTNIFNKARKARERARQEAIENGEIDPEEEKKSDTMTEEFVDELEESFQEEEFAPILDPNGSPELGVKVTISTEENKDSSA